MARSPLLELLRTFACCARCGVLATVRDSYNGRDKLLEWTYADELLDMAFEKLVGNAPPMHCPRCGGRSEGVVDLPPTHDQHWSMTG